MADANQQDAKTGMAVGIGAALGVVFGVVVFALNEDPVWIAIGLAFGVALGALFGTLLAKRQ